jgi:hypothetical protein
METIRFAARGRARRWTATPLILFTLAAPDRAAGNEPTPVAVFDMSFVNFGQEVEFGAKNEVEYARIAMLSAYLRALLEGSGRYRLIDTAPLADQIKLHGDVFSCNACEAMLARQVGAGRSITGSVQKLSALVQTVILRERDTGTEEIVALYQTDIRGNTDEAWRRGLSWLIRNRLLVQAEP